MLILFQISQYRDPKINVILRKQQKSSDLAEFLHGYCCAPVSSTFTRAIQNNQFVTWSDLTARLIKNHLLSS